MQPGLLGPRRSGGEAGDQGAHHLMRRRQEDRVGSLSRAGVAVLGSDAGVLLGEGVAVDQFTARKPAGVAGVVDADHGVPDERDVAGGAPERERYQERQYRQRRPLSRRYLSQDSQPGSAFAGGHHGFALRSGSSSALGRRRLYLAAASLESDASM